MPLSEDGKWRWDGRQWLLNPGPVTHDSLEASLKVRIIDPHKLSQTLQEKLELTAGEIAEMGIEQQMIAALEASGLHVSLHGGCPSCRTSMYAGTIISKENGRDYVFACTECKLFQHDALAAQHVALASSRTFRVDRPLNSPRRYYLADESAPLKAATPKKNKAMART